MQSQQWKHQLKDGQTRLFHRSLRPQAHWFEMRTAKTLRRRRLLQ
jgi:hypothetical protein